MSAETDYIIRFGRSGSNVRTKFITLTDKCIDVIFNLLTNATDEVNEKLQLLLQGNSIRISVDMNIIYPQIKSKPYVVFSFLLITGYLKVVNRIEIGYAEYVYEVAVPNREILIALREEILKRLDDLIPQDTATNMVSLSAETMLK